MADVPAITVRHDRGVVVTMDRRVEMWQTAVVREEQRELRGIARTSSGERAGGPIGGLPALLSPGIPDWVLLASLGIGLYLVALLAAFVVVERWVTLELW